MRGAGPVGLMVAEYTRRLKALLITVAVFAVLWPLILIGIAHIGINSPWANFFLGVLGNLLAVAASFLIVQLFKRWIL